MYESTLKTQRRPYALKTMENPRRRGNLVGLGYGDVPLCGLRGRDLFQQSAELLVSASEICVELRVPCE